MTTERTEPELRVVDNPAELRYEAVLGDRIVGISEYELEPGVITFIHTEVDERVEGQGIGSRLARGALDDVRDRGLRVVAHCPFISAYIRRHKDYQSLLG